MNIRNRNKIMTLLLILFTITTIPIILFVLAVNLFCALIFYTIAIIIAILIAIVEPRRYLVKKIEIEKSYLHPRKALLILRFIWGSIILTIFSSYLLFIAVIFIHNENVLLIVANILLLPMITGVVMICIGLYMVIVKDTWEKKPTSE